MTIQAYEIIKARIELQRLSKLILVLVELLEDGELSERARRKINLVMADDQ